MIATTLNDLMIAAIFGCFADAEVFPILLSMVGDETEVKERQEGVSVIFLFSSFGLLGAPIISSILLTSPQISLRNIH